MTREQIETFWQAWLEANRTAEKSGDWRPISEFYAEDATYGWMLTPDDQFMAVGRKQIQEWALGTEMEGLEGWHYDYQATVIDDVAGMVIGFWKQKAGVLDDEGAEYEIKGIGGSWFGLQEKTGGGLEFAWQRDWFDLGSTATTFLELYKSGRATAGLKARLKVDNSKQPGHYQLKDLPSTVWPPPVEAGRYVTQAASPEATA